MHRFCKIIDDEGGPIGDELENDGEIGPPPLDEAYLASASVIIQFYPYLDYLGKTI